MFESRVLNALSRVHPVVPALIFLPAIAVLGTAALGRMSAASAVALALGGYLFWTLTEYWMHRLVFHFEPDDGPGARLHWIIHGVHHDHPNDRMRLVMPPSVSVPLAFGFYGLFVLALALPPRFPFAAGSLPAF